jgi:quinol monooxygenase YgiN
MTIRHIVTIRVAAGKAPDFVRAFKALQATALQEPGRKEYALFQDTDDPDRLVMLERWTDQESLDRHMAAERSDNAALVDALVALWAPGMAPVVEHITP